MENYLVIRTSSGLAELVESLADGDLLIGNTSFFSNLLLEKLKEGKSVDDAISYVLVNFLNNNVLKQIIKELANNAPSLISLPHLGLSAEQVNLLTKDVDAKSMGPTRRIYNVFRDLGIKFNWQLVIYPPKDFLRLRSFGEKSRLEIQTYSKSLFGDNFEILFAEVREHLQGILNRKCSDIIELSYMSSYQAIIPFLFNPKRVQLKDVGLGRFSCGLGTDVTAMQSSFGNEKLENFLRDFQTDCTQLLMSTLTKS